MKREDSRFYKNTAVFVFTFFLALMPLLTENKGNIVLLINQYRTPFWDVFFQAITYLGTAWIYFIGVGIMLFVRYYDALILAINGVLHGIIIGITKKFIFTDHPRPANYLKGNPNLHLIDGFDHHMWNSMPSGHTATAFSFFLMLTLITKDRIWSPILFSIACLVGLSRIYLIQHFFEDVYFGGFIGCLITMCLWLYMERKIISNTKPWMDKSLRNR